mmetsp:Transcript_40243/g.78339  ORF Transcript_40243/g.78339 Transcript_40243/m.78339 type:complete len:134 (-) Transcript_40243:270-671(-)
MERLVKKVLEFNRESPCGFIGEGYNSIAVGSICKTTYLNLESLIPGIVVALFGILLGFTMLVVMRDCAIIDRQLMSPQPGSFGDMYVEEGKVDDRSTKPVGSNAVPLQSIDKPSTMDFVSRPPTNVGSTVNIV